MTWLANNASFQVKFPSSKDHVHLSISQGSVSMTRVVSRISNYLSYFNRQNLNPQVIAISGGTCYSRLFCGWWYLEDFVDAR